ncbi:MAG TPA: trypsin-like peptidase domain-containing protein, partial [Candidatus Binataceae bacterium]|nr:trypsin-like peptidase domain-containing protein [Candidatus Binataceae bacterium]
MRRFALLASFSILAASLPFTAANSIATAADNGRFWTEQPDGGHIAKAQNLPDFVDLAARLSPAVVNISSENSEESSGGGDVDDPHPHRGTPFEGYGPHAKSLGSGFIISKDGYVLTNDHVVSDSSKITVATQDGHQYPARLVGRDEKSDVALLQIKAKHDLPVAPLGDSDKVKVGQWVMAIGNPFGFDHSVTVGIVSARGR